MNSIDIRSNAKINLALDVLRRRPDGYHDVKMIMQSIPLYDHIEIKKTVSAGIRIKNNLPYLPKNENNLAYAAAKLMCETYVINDGIFITLEKRIPVAAGMAGGSSNAAAVLKAINIMFELGASIEQLSELGVKLGADVPYCLMGGTALSEGIGEKLKPLTPIPKCYSLVVKPKLRISTDFVYKNLVLDEHTVHPDVDKMIEAIERRDLHSMCLSMGNVLESVSISAHPEIAKIKEEIMQYGALNALMSGSGPTVFGIFDNHKAADTAFYNFKISDYGKQTYLLEL